MAEDEREWYERLLELQLLANPGIWNQLGKLGITEETELVLGFVFLAPDEAAARRLIGFLEQETDYEVQARSTGRGRNAQWVVAGVTQPAAVSLETINAWVEWMVAAGVANGPCAFDGWTARARIEDPVATGDAETAPGTAPPSGE
jgi:hypothetical protein